MKLASAFVLLAALSFYGCGDDDAEDGEQSASSETEEVADDPVAAAAQIAREIRESPDDSESILEAHGTTIEEFEEQMIEIAADEEKSARYEELLGDAEE